MGRKIIISAACKGHRSDPRGQLPLDVSTVSGLFNSRKR